MGANESGISILKLNSFLNCLPQSYARMAALKRTHLTAEKMSERTANFT